MNEMERMTDYEWLTEMHLCYRCRKERAAPNRKFCFECLEKVRTESQKRYDPEKAKLYQERRRELYRMHKAQGICVRCKKKATQGIYCLDCCLKEHRRSAERARKAKEKRHDRGLVTERRKRLGLCLWCGAPTVRGTYACPKHAELFSEAGKKGKNDIVFGKKER